jgi:hypothetical protein
MKLRIGNVATIIAINLLLQFLVGCQGKSSPECILTLGISNMKIPAKEILRLEKRVNQAPRQIQLISGSKIILSGVQVGTVSDITFDHSTKQNMKNGSAQTRPPKLAHKAYWATSTL